MFCQLLELHVSYSYDKEETSYINIMSFLYNYISKQIELMSILYRILLDFFPTPHPSPPLLQLWFKKELQCKSSIPNSTPPTLLFNNCDLKKNCNVNLQMLAVHLKLYASMRLHLQVTYLPWELSQIFVLRKWTLCLHF